MDGSVIIEDVYDARDGYLPSRRLVVGYGFARDCFGETYTWATLYETVLGMQREGFQKGKHVIMDFIPKTKLEFPFFVSLELSNWIMKFPSSSPPTLPTLPKKHFISASAQIRR